MMVYYFVSSPQSFSFDLSGLLRIPSIYLLLTRCNPSPVSYILYAMSFIRYTVSGISLINRGSRWVAHPLLEGLVTAARKAGLWNLWMPSTLAGEIFEGHAIVRACVCVCLCVFVCVFFVCVSPPIFPCIKYLPPILLFFFSSFLLFFFSSILQFFSFFTIRGTERKTPQLALGPIITPHSTQQYRLCLHRH